MNKMYLTGYVFLLTLMLSSFCSQAEVSIYNRDGQSFLDIYASFEVPVFSISGKDLKQLRTDGYKYVTAFFHAVDADGKIFEMEFYGMKINAAGTFELKNETHKFFIEGQRSFNFPCALANISWEIKLPPDASLPDNAIYNLIPYRNSQDGIKFIYYRWQRDPGSPGPDLSTGTFNPVPPRTTLFLSNGEKLVN